MYMHVQMLSLSLQIRNVSKSQSMERNPSFFFSIAFLISVTSELETIPADFGREAMCVCA